jgi:signal transduction histidine kinase
MKPRSLRVRTKVIALLVSLVALWGFAAFVTIRDGLNMLWVNALDQKYGRPTDSLIVALQTERRLSVAELGDDRQSEALLTARSHTDEEVADFRHLTQGTDVRLAASAQAEQRVNETIDRLAELGPTRDAIDAHRIDRQRAAAAYTNIINAGFRIYGSLATLDDPAIAKDGRTLVSLTRAREVLSQEDALLTGALVAGRITSDEHARFVELVGTQRFLRAEADAELPPADHVRYQALVDSTLKRLGDLEDRVIRGDPGRLPITADTWAAAMDPALTAMRDLVVAGVADVVERATPAAIGVIVRLALAGGLGLIAVIASIIVSITTARALVAQLEKLRRAALDLASRRLPAVVERLRRGERVDIAAEAPPLSFGSDEIGQVGNAINLVQQTAISTAVQQAELRDSVRDLFLGLARRSQALLHRQLQVLDAIERRETDPRELAELFHVDHLATRMRRNAENLIVLSGAAPGRRWRTPVPMVDVLRGAVAEVEDYTRVTTEPVEGVWLAGRAVSDVIHLVAELIENATSFSPPYTPVHVTGMLVANGFAIEVEDRGLGMSEGELEAANEQLRNPPDFNLSGATRLGLYVVARLAQRHGILIHLRRSPYGGTTAIVLIPRVLVVTDTEGIEVPGRHADAADATGGVAVEHGRNQLDGHDAGTRAPAPVGVESRPTSLENAEPSAAASGAALFEMPPVTEPTGSLDRPASMTDGPETTPSGLPFRVRQASLAAGLREADPPEDPASDQARSPEQVRQMLASYQQASRRGRADADRLPATPAMPDAPPDRADHRSPTVDTAADLPIGEWRWSTPDSPESDSAAHDDR